MLAVQLKDRMINLSAGIKAMHNSSNTQDTYNSGRQQRKMNFSTCVVLLMLSLYAAGREGELH